MKFRLSNCSYGEKDNNIKGDFEIIEDQDVYYHELTDTTTTYKKYYVVLNTIEDLVKFIQLNGTIYITDYNTLGYGDFYIE